MNRKYKHLTLDDRYAIKNGLENGESFKAIARTIGRDCTTVSKEVKGRRVFEQKGSYAGKFNDCAHRIGCTENTLCSGKACRTKRCIDCKTVRCVSLCSSYTKEVCKKRDTPPYVCNHCDQRTRCTLEKTIYSPIRANNEYKEVLSESRSGFDLDSTEISRLDDIISPLLRKGHSIHNICVNNSDKLMVGERTVYNYVDASLFSARNIDMPRKVRYCKRKVARSFKVDTNCRRGRTYADYLDYIAVHGDVSVVEMDTVHGVMGGKVLLTLHFVNAHFMLAYLMEDCTANSVSEVFVHLRKILGTDLFSSIFQVLLTDNGSEFSNPKSIEFDEEGEGVTRIFYCDPGQSQQKGAAENNHEMIRRIVPKGEPFDLYHQQDITLMMNHINSYGRLSLHDHSPHSVFEFLFGSETLKKLGAELVQPDNVTLRPSLLKKQ